MCVCVFPTSPSVPWIRHLFSIHDGGMGSLQGYVNREIDRQKEREGDGRTTQEIDHLRLCVLRSALLIAHWSRLIRSSKPTQERKWTKAPCLNIDASYVFIIFPCFSILQERGREVEKKAGYITIQSLVLSRRHFTPQSKLWLSHRGTVMRACVGEPHPSRYHGDFIDCQTVL